MQQLEEGLQLVHTQFTEAGADRHRPPATTLIMALLVRSRAYIVHVSDSRARYLREGRLRVLTRDQTMADELLDMGAITAEQATRSSLTHQLVSAVGGSQMTPSVGLVDLQRDDMFLLCSDRLTKHSNDRIAAVLAEPISVELMCTELLDDALKGGGTDNISLVVARLLA